jgi:cytochrome P450
MRTLRGWGWVERDARAIAAAVIFALSISLLRDGIAAAIDQRSVSSRRPRPAAGTLIDVNAPPPAWTRYRSIALQALTYKGGS